MPHMHEQPGDHDQGGSPFADESANGVPELRGRRPALGQALRERYQRKIDVPADRDAAIRRSIAAQFGAERAPVNERSAFAYRRWALAAAAAIVITGSLWMYNFGPWGGAGSSQPGVGPGAPAAPPALARRAAADVDGNGLINILDAFALARQVDANEPRSPRRPTFDLNSDGRTDRGDVDVIAMQAVALGGRAERGTGS